MIEKRLEKKLTAFNQAVVQGNEELFSGQFPDSKLSVAQTDLKAWGRLEEEATRDPFAFLKSNLAARHHFLSSNQINIILAARLPAEVDTLILDLKQSGYIQENRDYSRHTFLRSLGMVALSLPPLKSLIHGLAQFKQVLLVGDGDAVLKLVPRVKSPPEAFNMGALDAVARAMNMERKKLLQFFLESPLPVKVAVMDSGIDPQHPDLRGRVVASKDFSMAQLGAVDPYGHGTHVAGIIAGYNPEDPLFSGIAPTARLLDAQVMEPQGFTTVFQVLLGMEWALEAGAHILNLSFGHSPYENDPDLLEWRAVSAALRLGVLTCAAAGNAGESVDGPHINCPGDCPDAICVGAVDATMRKASFSSYGPAAHAELSGLKPDLMAPGAGIISTRARTSHLAPWQGDVKYCAASGTSSATPVISGILALAMGWARARRLDLNAVDLKNRLLASCVNSRNQADYEVGRGVPDLPRFFAMLESKTLFAVGGERGSMEPRPPVATLPPEPIAIKIPELRRQEQDLINYWQRRVENRLSRDPSCLGTSRRLTIEWQLSHQESKLKDLRLYQHLDEDIAKRIPLLVRAEGVIRRGSRIDGIVVCRYLADQAALAKNRFEPLSAQAIDQVAGLEWKAHEKKHGDEAPLFLAIGGSFDNSVPLTRDFPDQHAVINQANGSWHYHGPAEYDALWKFFYPVEDQALLQQMESWLDKNLSGAILAETIASELALPVQVVIALGGTSKRYQLEFRNGCHAFFRT